MLKTLLRIMITGWRPDHLPELNFLPASHLLIVVAVLGVAAVNHQQAEGSPIRPGDTVTTTQDSALQVGTETLAVIPSKTTLIVTEVQDGWIAVTYSWRGQKMAGWLAVGHVVPTDASTKTAEGRHRKMNTTTVQTDAGTTITASIPATIEAREEGDELSWNYAVTFSCDGEADSTVKRIDTQHIDQRGHSWNSRQTPGLRITVPTRGGVHYRSAIRNKYLVGGTLVITFSGVDGNRSSFHGGSEFRGELSAKLVAGRPKAGAVKGWPKRAKAAILSIGESERRILADAKSWKVEVIHDLPHNSRETDVLGIRRNCEELLRRVGLVVDDNAAAVVLKVRVFGVATPAEYVGVEYGRRYSGAEVTVNATIESVDPPKTIVTFSEATGGLSPPQSVAGGKYKTLQDAPYALAFRMALDFPTQLLSVTYSLKGPQAVHGLLADQKLGIESPVLDFIAASGDRSFVPLLLADLQSDDSWCARHERHLIDVAECLVSLGAGALAVEPLAARLSDKKNLISDTAAVAIERIGDPKAIPYLRSALLSASSHPRYVASALRALNWQPDNAREKVIFWLALRESDKIRELGDEALPVLKELAQLRNWASSRAAKVLAELGTGDEL